MPEDPTALVTGAAGGISCRVSLTLTRRGYRVAANGLEDHTTLSKSYVPPEPSTLRTG